MLNPSNQPARMIPYPIIMPGMYVIAVIVIAWMPMPMESPRGRSLCLVAYRNPVSNTMNDAPSREPDNIVKAWNFEIVPAPNRLIAVAATGEPESTK